MAKKIKRILISDCLNDIGNEVTVAGWVHTVRAHGKIAFFDLRDRSGVLQIGVFSPELAKEVATFGSQDVVRVTGTVKKRDERYINKESATGTIELEVKSVEVLEKSAEMPFDMGGKELHLELPTLLDYRTLTLRHSKQQMIFKIQAALSDHFRKAAETLECVEIHIPTIAASATEGGAEVFMVDYYGHKAFMTQSPQLYKQMMVGVFERVFTIAHAYRAEPSVTTRHLSESTQMDVEMAFVTFEELLDALEFVGTSIVKHTVEQYPDVFTAFGIEKPLIPTNVPRLTLREAQEIVSQRTGRDLRKELDLNPEDEKEICVWAKEEKGSDFVTITHYPTKKRAFYTMPDPENPEYSLSYDLLFRGLEILSGSQRVNNYNQLLEIMNDRGVDPAGFFLYLQAFKYGIPPEGGFSFGLERVTMKLLELSNVREASLFPRDMERVDERFSKKEQKAEKVHEG
jgi:nondiscriminating aspartyl-tRNA synthetase